MRNDRSDKLRNSPDEFSNSFGTFQNRSRKLRNSSGKFRNSSGKFRNRSGKSRNSSGKFRIALGFSHKPQIKRPTLVLMYVCMYVSICILCVSHLCSQILSYFFCAGESVLILSLQLLSQRCLNIGMHMSMRTDPVTAAAVTEMLDSMPWFKLPYVTNHTGMCRSMLPIAACPLYELPCMV